MRFKKQAIVPLQIDEKSTIDFTCYHVLSKTKDTHLLEKLFNGDIFHVQHPQTNEHLPVMYPCAYIDENKKFIVLFNPEESIPHEQLSTSLFDGLPDDISDYTLRETHYLTEFYEKLNVLDYGLRDTEMECVKLLTHTLFKEQYPEKEIVHTFFFDDNGIPSFTFVSKDNQETTPYRQELVDVVNERVHTLDLPKGNIHIVSPHWAIKALNL
ncbi:hypothetical protein KG090_06665 [Carnobacteriaceae bacterium zg-ZUI240]|nr:hypothetical protein [Carnobacteriaceae bacterium zg-ZUI240]